MAGFVSRIQEQAEALWFLNSSFEFLQTVPPTILRNTEQKQGRELDISAPFGTIPFVSASMR
jgi:hypothetical protein